MRTGLRIKILKLLLSWSGFRRILDHWVYIRSINKDSVIIDGGANIGLFSKEMINRFKVSPHAVEANPLLYYSLKLDNRIKAINVALCSKDGTIVFYQNSNLEASSIINKFQDIWAESKKISVEGCTYKSLLDKLKLNNRTIDILKLDIEGAELDILEKMADEDFNNINQISVEFHHHLNNSLLVRTKSVIKKLLDIGYLPISCGISPSEILFIKPNSIKPNFKQKILLNLFLFLKFKPYEEY